MERPIRVALLDLPPLIGDVVHKLISSQSDMRVATIKSHEWRDAAIDEVADVYVVATEPDGSCANTEYLLMQHVPARRVIDISADGRHMQLTELRPASTDLGALSAQELLDVIRRGNRRTTGSDASAFNTGV
ncbi:MAG: hypothetical protein ABI120_09175 [Gemmatimonadaceae bacterium]